MKLVNGWLDEAEHCVSPNYNARPFELEPDLLIVHNISLPPGMFGGDYVQHFFSNQLDASEHPFFEEIKGLEVSSHFYIRRSGKIIQFVSTEERAWHAGVSSFDGVENCNDFSIGIELEGTDVIPYEDAQYRSLVKLTKVLQQHYPSITNDRLAGHSDVAPGRKTDPGEVFDWSYYKSLLNDG